MTQSLTTNTLKISCYPLNYLKTERSLKKRAKKTPTITIHRGNFCKKKFAARYLDPRTSRWLGVDPAMGEYVPSAPINDEAKKRNGNLPGMGGVFNYVNFHVYHYGANNPVNYVDPDGRVSGFVLDENGAGGFGHAGMYVQTEKGFSFFEVTGITDKVKAEAEEGKANILSESNIIFPTTGLARKADMPTIACVVQRDFSTKDEMDLYLADNGFTTALEFNTNKSQDKLIYNEAIKAGEAFRGYMLIGNNCGLWARDVLTTKGSGVISDYLPDMMGGPLLKNIPNHIDLGLQYNNPGSTRRLFY